MREGVGIFKFRSLLPTKGLALAFAGPAIHVGGGATFASINTSTTLTENLFVTEIHALRLGTTAKATAPLAIQLTFDLAESAGLQDGDALDVDFILSYSPDGASFFTTAIAGPLDIRIFEPRLEAAVGLKLTFSPVLAGDTYSFFLGVAHLRNTTGAAFDIELGARMPRAFSEHLLLQGVECVGPSSACATLQLNIHPLPDGESQVTFFTPGPLLEDETLLLNWTAPIGYSLQPGARIFYAPSVAYAAGPGAGFLYTPVFLHGKGQTASASTTATFSSVDGTTLSSHVQVQLSEDLPPSSDITALALQAEVTLICPGSDLVAFQLTAAVSHPSSEADAVVTVLQVANLSSHLPVLLAGETEGTSLGTHSSPVDRVFLLTTVVHNCSGALQATITRLQVQLQHRVASAFDDLQPDRSSSAVVLGFSTPPSVDIQVLSSDLSDTRDDSSVATADIAVHETMTFEVSSFMGDGVAGGVHPRERGGGRQGFVGWYSRGRARVTRCTLGRLR
jgi:hypothetical protein